MGVEEDLDQLARQIEATNAEEKETRGKKKRRRRRRQEMRERRTMLKEDLCWLENALKRMENSLLGTKHATLADLEKEIEKEGPDALQQVLNQFKELQERKLNIETELDQLSDGQQIENQFADPTTSADEVEPVLSLPASGRESETVHIHLEQEKDKKLQQEQQRMEKIVAEARRCNDLIKIETGDVKEDKTRKGYDELLTGHPHPTNQKEDEKDIFSEDREGNRQHEDEGAKQSEENRKKSEQMLKQVSLSNLQIDEEDDDLKWSMEKEILEESGGKKCEEERKGDHRVEGKMGSVVLCEKRKRWQKKVCWLCAAAKTCEGFDLHWCAGCRKAR